MANLILELDEYPDKEFVLRIAPVSGRDYWNLVEMNVQWTREGIAALASALEPYIVTWPLDELPADADPNVLLALRNTWAVEVRSVPLPLPQRRSAGTPSSEDPSPPPSPEPSSPTE